MLGLVLLLNTAFYQIFKPHQEGGVGCALFTWGNLFREVRHLPQPAVMELASSRGPTPKLTHTFHLTACGSISPKVSISRSQRKHLHRTPLRIWNWFVVLFKTFNSARENQRHNEKNK